MPQVHVKTTKNTIFGVLVLHWTNIFMHHSFLKSHINKELFFISVIIFCTKQQAEKLMSVRNEEAWGLSGALS